MPAFELKLNVLNWDGSAILRESALERLEALASEHGFTARYPDIPILARKDGPLQGCFHVFKGLRRPRTPSDISDPAALKDEGDAWYIDSNALVFVSQPKIRYKPDPNSILEKVKSDEGTVFVAYLVLFNESARRHQVKEEENLDLAPVANIIGFEWLKADPSNPTKPLGWESRYDGPYENGK